MTSHSNAAQQQALLQQQLAQAQALAAAQAQAAADAAAKARADAAAADAAAAKLAAEKAAAAAAANEGNFIVNGTFEDGSTGWVNQNPKDFGVAGVEVGPASDYGVGVSPTNKVLEIDYRSDGTDAIAQTVNLQSGKTYVLTFDYAGRKDYLASSAFEVLVNDTVIGTFTPTTTDFKTQSITFTAPANASTIAFREIGSQSNSYGGIIDNVSLRGGLDANANGNLLYNGSFELGPNGAVGNTAPGWVNTTSPASGVEVNPASAYGVTGSTTNKVMEIDNGLGDDTIAQTVATTDRQAYTVAFNYAKRAGTDTATNTFDVFWNGDKIGSISPNLTEFTTFSTTVTGKGPTGTLSFHETGTNDGFGGIVDNVSLVPKIASNQQQAGLSDPVINMNAGANVISGAAGNQKIVGNAELNTIVYADVSQSAAAISTTNGVTTVTTGPYGTDTLQGIERLQFKDGVIAYDVLGDMGDAYRLYEAAFNRLPDPGGLTYWTHLLDLNVSLQTVASGFLNSDEFKGTYGGLTNTEIVNKLYLNILGRAGEADGVNYWVGLLNNKALVRDVLIGFANSPENHTNIDPTLVGGISLTKDAFLA